MSQFHTVIRPFEGDRPFRAGDVVDVSAWRTARQLVERRYLRPATVAEIELATAPPEVPPAPTRRKGAPDAE